jgi:hypothetical protein
MEFSRHGMSIVFGGAPVLLEAIQQQAVLFGVRPAHPLNRVDVRYRVNGGPERLSHATMVQSGLTAMVRSGLTGGEQTFRWILPWLPPGAQVDFGPVLANSGRVLDTAAVAGRLPAGFRSEGSVLPEAPGSPLMPASRFPFRLEPLYSLDALLRVEVVGVTPDGLRFNFYLLGGTVSGPKLNGTVLPEGGDWMRVRPDGIGLTNIHASVRTTDGALVLVEADGYFDFGADGYEPATRGVFPEVGRLVTIPKLRTADPRYQWLNRATCFDVGIVEMKNLALHYDAFQVVYPEVR